MPPSPAAPGTTPLPHLDASLSASERAELLLRQMTLEEKCGQLSSFLPWTFVNPDGSVLPGSAQELLASCPPGHIAQLITDDPAQLARLVGAVQRQFLTRTRLGIPALFHAEALNGPLAGGHMVYPTAIGLGATFSPDLVRAMSDLTRRQLRRAGIAHVLSPVMDIALDPRWGRVHETYGEDPYLAAALSVAYTQGMQGDDLREGVIATAKHFLGYAASLGGRNQASVDLGPRRLRDLYAYPFEAAIHLAGLGSVMNSYAAMDGVPVSLDRSVLTTLLRDVLGFDGFVSSDYDSLPLAVDVQKAAATPAEAARLALTAGLDVEFPAPYGYGEGLAELVRNKELDESVVDTSVLRVLRAKFALGLFENPYPHETIDVRATATEGRELSRELARRAVVLAANDTRLLPLPADRSLHVAVLGPHADTVLRQFPAYTFPAWREAVNGVMEGAAGTMAGAQTPEASWFTTVLEAADPEQLARTRYGARPLGEEIGEFARSVTVEPGCGLIRELDDEAAAVAAAVRAAEDCDVVVLALGGASLWFTGDRTEGEDSDTADISLPGVQTRLAEAVAATGKPLVVVLFQGRPYTLPDVVRSAQALVIAPFGGPFGTSAVAEVLFGAVDPSGKLPYSVPRHTGQIPVYHHQPAGTGYRKPVAPHNPHHYLDMTAAPLYPFGHGLGYTSFELSELSYEAEVATDGRLTVSAVAANSGARSGATVVQLYVGLRTAGLTRPAQQLAGFERVELAPGERRRVTFTVDASQLGCTGTDGAFAVRPSAGELFLGLDSDDKRLTGEFTLAGPVRTLRSAERAFLSETGSTAVTTG
ncbi:glycoside hydrolase family 3 N-terminal domain-containing protein [Streptomyces sp. NPDC048288]|uniref:glycoside hydrolase family 3 N-terminal domain-containing protein n=1 Tax=Streptomyces sp. NPDC048288 TaxID=3365529 RepID=UPI003713A535